MLDEFTYLLADFTSCKFSFGEESILQEKTQKQKKILLIYHVKKK
jgi:hypothetical protein